MRIFYLLGLLFCLSTAKSQDIWVFDNFFVCYDYQAIITDDQPLFVWLKYPNLKSIESVQWQGSDSIEFQYPTLPTNWTTPPNMFKRSWFFNRAGALEKHICYTPPRYADENGNYLEEQLLAHTSDYSLLVYSVDIRLRPIHSYCVGKEGYSSWIKIIKCNKKHQPICIRWYYYSGDIPKKILTFNWDKTCEWLTEEHFFYGEGKPEEPFRAPIEYRYVYSREECIEYLYYWQQQEKKITKTTQRIRFFDNSYNLIQTQFPNHNIDYNALPDYSPVYSIDTITYSYNGLGQLATEEIKQQLDTSYNWNLFYFSEPDLYRTAIKRVYHYHQQDKNGEWLWRSAEDSPYSNYYRFIEYW